MRCKALQALLADAHFQAMGEKRRGGTPTAEEDDEGVVDSTGDTGTLGGHRRLDGTVAAEDSG